MSIFVLKIIAYTTMFLDHIKYIDSSSPVLKNFVTIYFGRIAFPLFAFMISEGYAHTKNLKKYYTRLIVIAIISQIPYMLLRSLFDDEKMLNIMFTLILGLSCITLYDTIKEKYLSIPICVLIILLGKQIKVDYRVVWSYFNTIFLYRKK